MNNIITNGIKVTKNDYFTLGNWNVSTLGTSFTGIIMQAYGIDERGNITKFIDTGFSFKNNAGTEGRIYVPLYFDGYLFSVCLSTLNSTAKNKTYVALWLNKNSANTDSNDNTLISSIRLCRSELIKGQKFCQWYCGFADNEDLQTLS